jgi:CheY-specific phosphatase CheX
VQQKIRDLVTQTWQNILGQEVQPTSIYALEGFSLAACIHLVGDWQGAMTLVMEESVGRAVAARMFQMAPEDVKTEHLADALGELVNMLGGVFKSNLEGRVYLSLPVVIRGGMDLIGSELVCVQDFECEEGAFEVTLYTHSKSWADAARKRVVSEDES